MGLDKGERRLTLFMGNPYFQFNINVYVELGIVISEKFFGNIVQILVKTN